ncbi:response regulator [Cohnella zeiphila]|uniref:Response regulator transcription factor n=1 Tax=Cohnella zeiphila TaxID=2761120 RepID=A0A7X0SIM2_9BACL|nr:response regulator [Cohnella zeiphila]MBB6730678.1 response regulator transcription factor [Cohnella zeiphila]
MFRMMIVDDEPLVRKGIATSIDWQEHGIEIVAEAGNGKDALQRLQSLPVDLVLADIRMPVMTGIEMSEQIKERYPDTAIVLLSGYEDFGYAKAALQIGIQNYLLKPASAEKLISVIVEIRDKKRQERQSLKQEMSRTRIFNENLPFLKYKLMSSLLKGELGAAEIEEKSRTLQIDLQGPEYHILLLDIDDFWLFSEKQSQKQNEAFTFAVFNIAEETLLSYFSGFVCYGELNRLVALVSSHKIHSLLAVCQEIQANVKRHLKLSVTIGIGQSCSSLADIRRSYQEAVQALKEKVYRGKGQVFLFAANQRQDVFDGERSAPFTAEEKTMVRHLKLMDEKELLQSIRQYFLRFASENIPFVEVKHACVRLVFLFIQELEEIGSPKDVVFGPQFIPHVAIERFEVVADLEAWLARMAAKLVRHIEENHRNTFKRTVKEAIRYMEGHYDQPISLTEVSDHVNVTPAYFSKLFKEEMGITFVKWLNRLRVEKAKALLKETSLKTYEIAEKVGYYDYKYFSNTFRKYTGVSPRDYRNR